MLPSHNKIFTVLTRYAPDHTKLEVLSFSKLFVSYLLLKILFVDQGKENQIQAGVLYLSNNNANSRICICVVSMVSTVLPLSSVSPSIHHKAYSIHVSTHP